MKNLILTVLTVLGLASVFTACHNEKPVCQLRVATFNLRLDTPDDNENQWTYRKDLAKQLIRFHDFDIFGTQEGFRNQLDDILQLGNYTCIGEGRDGNDEGEHSAIFFKTDKFDLLDKGDFWYSETPDKVGLGWDATCCNRICSWGKFREKNSGKTFYFFNSHFDHEGVVARRESARLMLTKIKEIAGTDTPVFATGDYNANSQAKPIQIILKDGLLKDAYDISVEKPYGAKGTYHGYNPKASSEGRIDHIFVTGQISVLKYGTLNETPEGHYPSDHYPVMIIAEL